MFGPNAVSLPHHRRMRKRAMHRRDMRRKGSALRHLYNIISLLFYHFISYSTVEDILVSQHEAPGLILHSVFLHLLCQMVSPSLVMEWPM